MNTRQLIGLTAIALAAGSASADDGSLTRAQVRQDVIAARAAGTLVPAGEGVTPGYPAAADGASALTRAQVRAETLQARAEGLLAAAGEGTPANRIYAQAVAASPTITRAEMRQEVLAARASGDLIPAGEGARPSYEQHGTHVALREDKSLLAIFHRRR